MLDGEPSADELSDAADCRSQAVESLRAAMLVEQMAVDEQQAGAVGQALDDMGVPDLVEQCPQAVFSAFRPSLPMVCSRITNFWILPVMVIGNSATNSM